MGAGCDKTNEVDQSTNVQSGCTTPTAELAKLCPFGTALEVTGASAVGNPVCPAGGGVVTDANGQPNGVCKVTTECSVRCKSTCPCGIKKAAIDSFECAACPVCGDGKCEGGERLSCGAGEQGCIPCEEDCAGSNCGDGVCNGASESATTCPEDCAKACKPNSVTCAGNKVKKCSANGADFIEIDCGEGFLCVEGQCSKSNSCGNKVCEPEGGEDALKCPQDCATCGNGTCDQGEQVSCPQDCGACDPNSKICVGDKLRICNAQGTAYEDVDCAATGQICGNGQCQQANICGNSKCEGDEAQTCPSDCASKCGNKVCDDGEKATCPSDCVACGNKVCEAEEELTCPQDCATCGNKVCELGEQQSCPTDCGVCKPGAKECLGNTLRVCNANGSATQDIDCGSIGQTCGLGKCVVKDVCGNGACEGAESETCPDDCVQNCGDGACGPGEDYETCPKDCDPPCGDQICSLPESKATCAQDCPALCGNKACDKASGETREKCPVDCGYCGDGVCDASAESAQIKPPAPLESCPNDCVKFSCAKDADCDDKVSCTTNTCVAGQCVYVPDDNQCSSLVNGVCLEGQGCCEDKDGDGVAALSCGGYDCDDDDPLTFPGATESCDGVDRNCSGDNRPALGLPVQVTKDFAFKSKLSVVRGNGVTFAAWVGKPEAADVLQYALIDNAGKLVSGKVFTTEIPVFVIKTAYSEQIDVVPPIKRFAVAWVDQASDFVRMDWVSQAGALANTPVELADIKYFAEGNSKVSKAWKGFGWAAGKYLTTYTETSNYCNSFGCQPPGVTYRALLSTEDGIVTPLGANFTPEGTTILTRPDSFLVVGGRYAGVSLPPVPAMQSLKPDGTSPGSVDLASNVFSGHVVWDGELLASLGYDPFTGDMSYQRFAASGAAIATVKLPTLKGHVPEDIAHAPGKTPDEPGRTGLLTSQGQTRYFSARNQNGTEAIKVGQILSEPVFNQPHLFWNGSSFVVIYLGEDKNKVQQVYQATILCK